VFNINVFICRSGNVGEMTAPCAGWPQHMLVSYL